MLSNLFHDVSFPSAETTARRLQGFAACLWACKWRSSFWCQSENPTNVFHVYDFPRSPEQEGGCALLSPGAILLRRDNCWRCQFVRSGVYDIYDAHLWRSIQEVFQGSQHGRVSGRSVAIGLFLRVPKADRDHIRAVLIGKRDLVAESRLLAQHGYDILFKCLGEIIQCIRL